MKKRILIWESHAILGGGQRIAIQIAETLRSTYECFFVVPQRGQFAEALKQLGFSFQVIPIGQYSFATKNLKDIIKFLLVTPTVLLRVLSYLKTCRIDLIYANGARTFPWSIVLSQLLCIPVIWHIHNYFEDRKTLVLLNILAHFSSVKKIIFVSKTVLRQFPRLRYKSKVIYNPIDIQRLIRVKLNSCSLHEELNLSRNTRLISVIGWVRPAKKQDVLIQSIPFLLKERRDIHFIIVGEIDEAEYTYYEKLQEVIANLDIEDYVTFLGHRNDVPQILNDTFINVITSFEAFPLVLLETCAAGVPTVAPNLGGTGELIEHGFNGLLYAFGDAKDLAEKILLLLNDQMLYAKLSDGCRKWVSQYDTKRFGREITSIVQEIIEGNKLPS